MNFEEIKMFMLSLQHKDSTSAKHTLDSGSIVVENNHPSQSGETQNPPGSMITSVSNVSMPYVPIYTSMHSTPVSMSHTQLSTPLTPPHTAVYTVPTSQPTIFPTNNNTASSVPHQLVIPHPTSFGYQNQLPMYTHPSHNPPPFVSHNPTSTHHNFNPMPKIEFPKFDGNDPKGWVIKAEQYFEFISIDDFRKVKLSGLHFEGKANVWYRFYQSGRSNIPWKVFQLDVINRFEDPDTRDVQDLFNKLSQTGSVSEYEDRFEELRALVVTKNRNLTEEYFVSSFISGLQEHIKGAVKMFRPQTLTDTVFLAKQEESKTKKSYHQSGKTFSKFGSMGTTEVKKVQFPTYTSTPQKSGYKNAKNKSTLSSKEIMERRSKGLCFHCDESYHPGRECKAKLYSLTGELDESKEEEEGIEEVIQEMETMFKDTEILGEISLNAMAGNKSKGIVRLQGTIKKHPVSILVDSGSTHSFIDKSLVKKLGLIVEVIPPLIVTVADGSQVLVESACKQLSYSIRGTSSPYEAIFIGRV